MQPEHSALMAALCRCFVLPRHAWSQGSLCHALAPRLTVLDPASNCRIERSRRSRLRRDSATRRPVTTSFRLAPAVPWERVRGTTRSTTDTGSAKQRRTRTTTPVRRVLWSPAGVGSSSPALSPVGCVASTGQLPGASRPGSGRLRAPIRADSRPRRSQSRSSSVEASLPLERVRGGVQRGVQKNSAPRSGAAVRTTGKPPACSAIRRPVPRLPPASTSVPTVCSADQNRTATTALGHDVPRCGVYPMSRSGASIGPTGSGWDARVDYPCGRLRRGAGGARSAGGIARMRRANPRRPRTRPLSQAPAGNAGGRTRDERPAVSGRYSGM